jgi:hypothetical protein
MNRTVLMILLGSLLMGSRSAHAAVQADPMESRVTIDYRSAAAADVIRTLASAAGLTVEIGLGTLRPVTITLTNVKLGTALNAICENALCSWRLAPPGATAGISPMVVSLRVTPLPSEKAALLPPRVSFSLSDTPASDVFRAIGAAIGVPVTIEPGLPSDLVSLRFNDAMTPEVLNMLCNQMKCAWDFDPERGLRVMKKP